MRIVLTLLLFAHGVAHLPGFAVPWRLMTSPELPYRTTVFGSIDLGDTGIRIAGMGWAAMAIGFAALAWLNWAEAPWFRPAAFAAVAASTVLCLSAWPEARIGLAANIAIAALVLFR